MQKFRFYYVKKNTAFSVTSEVVDGVEQYTNRPKTFRITTIMPETIESVVIEADTFEQAEAIYKREYKHKD